MCTVSMIGDWGRDKLTDPTYQWPVSIPNAVHIGQISRAEYELLLKTVNTNSADLIQLRKDMEEIKELLRRAKVYDEVNNEPHCEMEDKVELLKRLAKLVGVDLSQVFND